MAHARFRKILGSVVVCGLLIGASGVAASPAYAAKAHLKTTGSATGSIDAAGNFHATVPGNGSKGATSTTNVVGKLGPASVSKFKKAKIKFKATANQSPTPGTADFNGTGNNNSMTAGVQGQLSPSGTAPSFSISVSITCTYNGSTGNWRWVIIISW